MTNYDFQTNSHKASRIYELTQGGLTLFPWDRELVARSINPDIAPNLETSLVLDQIDKSLASNTYWEGGLSGKPALRADHQGLIYFKGYLVDHVHPAELKAYHHSKRSDELVDICNRCEYLGLTPSIQNIRSRPLWEHITTPYDPFLFFVEHLSRIYQWRTDLLICHTQIQLSSDALYRFRYVKTVAKTFKEDSRQLQVPFDYFARDNSFQEVYFDPQTTGALDKWLTWFDTIDFKYWYLNPEAHHGFVIKAMDHGHTIEVPESTYNYFLNVLPPEKMNHIEDFVNWFLAGEPVKGDAKSTTYHAFGQANGKFYAKDISILK